MAIARRVGYGKKIVLGDKKWENAQAIAGIMCDAGFDVTAVKTDISSRDSIRNLTAEAQKYGEVSLFVNAAGVSPSQASIRTILNVDLYGTAVLLEEVGRIIRKGGAGVTISSQSGHRLPGAGGGNGRTACLHADGRTAASGYSARGAYRRPLHAYQLAKRCNVKRVMAEAV